MSEQLFLPEFMYAVDSDMNWEKLKSSHHLQTPITGRVTHINLKNRYITVDLGNNFITNMPFDESTIYPIYKWDNSLSSSIVCLLNKRIQVHVVDIEGTNILISRKRNMLKAFAYFKEQKEIKYAAIVGFDKLSTYIDIGAGITGRILAKDFSPILFRNPLDLELHRGDIISVNVLSYMPDRFLFNLSRDLSKVDDSITANNLVTCKVFDKVDNDPNNIGYYVLINRTIKGIVDSCSIKLNYGDKIIAKVKQITNKGAKLDFVKKL